MGVTAQKGHAFGAGGTIRQAISPRMRVVPGSGGSAGQVRRARGAGMDEGAYPKLPGMLSRAQDIADWVERTCHVPEGMRVGQPIQLAQFQQEAIRATQVGSICAYCHKQLPNSDCSFSDEFPHDGRPHAHAMLTTYNAANFGAKFKRAAIAHARTSPKYTPGARLSVSRLLHLALA
jgi:hypothetical protein